MRTLSKHAPISRLLRILWLPLLILTLVPLVPVELGWLSPYDWVVSSLPDVLYFQGGALGLAAGHVPYAPGFMAFPYEHVVYVYPPLTLLMTLPPLLAGSRYLLAFSLEMLVLVLVGSLVMSRASQRMGYHQPLGMAVLVLTLCLGPLVVTRVDAVLGLLVAGSALALMRRRDILAVALVSLAVLIKETAALAALPVVLFCIFPDLSGLLSVRQRLCRVALGMLPAVLIFAVVGIWSRGGEISSILASLHRGLEIESVPASFAILLSHFVPLHTYQGHLRSEQFATADAGALALTATVVGAIVVMAGAVRFAIRRRQPATAIAFCVAVGLCATPVLSPQYFLELMPVLAVAIYLELPARRAAQILGLALLTGVVTQAEYPYLFDALMRLQPSGIIVILVRNALLIGLVILLALPVTGLGPAGSGRRPAGGPQPLPRWSGNFPGWSYSAIRATCWGELQSHSSLVERSSPGQGLGSRTASEWLRWFDGDQFRGARDVAEGRSAGGARPPPDRGPRAGSDRRRQADVATADARGGRAAPDLADGPDAPG